MTREQAWRIVQRSYFNMPIDPDTLAAALNKINYRRTIKPRLHPLPADIRNHVNLVLLFKLGLAIAENRYNKKYANR